MPALALAAKPRLRVLRIRRDASLPRQRPRAPRPARAQARHRRPRSAGSAADRLAPARCRGRPSVCVHPAMHRAPRRRWEAGGRDARQVRRDVEPCEPPTCELGGAGSSGLPSRSLPSRPAHVQQTARPFSASGWHGEAPRPCQQTAIVDPHLASDAVTLICPRPFGRPDGQHRIDPGIAGMPGPARQAAIPRSSRSRPLRGSRATSIGLPSRSSRHRQPTTFTPSPSPCGRGSGGGGHGQPGPHQTSHAY